MFNIFLQIIWLGLPAAFANMAPPIAKKLFPKWKYPVDFNKKFRGKRIFGENKSIRGALAGIIIGELVFLLQQSLASNSHIQTINILHYNFLPWYFGFLFGVGAIGGDMVESFFKRQFDIAEGRTWFPLDQVDWAIGTLLLLLVFVQIPFAIIIAGLAVGIVLHIIVKLVGYYIGFDSKPI